MKALAANFGLALFSIVLALVLGEIVFRVAGYSPLDATYVKSHQFWDRDSSLGWVHRQGIEDTFVGPLPWPVEFESRVTLNAHGLRGPELEARPSGGLRVLFTGDSRTAGFEVEDEETFAALLSARLSSQLGRPVEDLNAGVRGYGTDQSWIAFLERWRTLEPDLVVHMHSFNDPLDNLVLYRAKRIFGKPAFRLDPENGIERVGTPVPTYDRCAELRLRSASEVVAFDTPRTRFFCRAQLSLVNPSALFSFVQARIQQRPDLVAAVRGLLTPAELQGEDRSYDASGSGGSARQEKRYELTRRLLRAYADDVERSGAAFVVAGYGVGMAELGPDTLRERGLQVLDISAIETEDGPPIHFKNDVHWNAEGHRRVAEALAGTLGSRLVD